MTGKRWRWAGLPGVVLMVAGCLGGGGSESNDAAAEGDSNRATGSGARQSSSEQNGAAVSNPGGNESGSSTGGTAGTGGSFGQPTGLADADFGNAMAAAGAGAFDPATGALAGMGGTAGTGAGAAPAANTNVSLGGAQDFGYFRSLLAAGRVPAVGDFDAAGFFAEHHTPLPEPDCGERICLQSMLAVLGNLMNGENCTMLQLGLNSPIAANPDERPPLNLAVVVDVSGSMNTGGKIDFVRDGLGLLIDGMRDTDKLALISYSDNAQVLFPLADVSMNRVELRSIASELVAEGSTNLYEGLEAGYQELASQYDSARQNRVILLSDGVPTAGITGESSIMDMSRGYNSDGMGLTTIGLGTDFNGVLMRGLGEQGDGNTYFLENSGAVSEVFTEELSYFTVPVAFDLELHLVAGEHYAFRRAYGSSFWEDTADGGNLAVPSVFLAHRESHMDVTDEGGRRGGGSALMIELMPNLSEDDGSGIEEAVVATVDVSFREPGTNETIEDHVTVTFPMGPWLVPEQGFFQSPDLAIIQKSFVMLNIYVAFEEASTLFYSNQASDALALLENVIAGVTDYNEEIEDVDIEYDLQMLEDMRDLVAQNGIELPTDFSVPENPWPVDD